MEFITHFVGFLLGYFFKVSNLAGLPLHSVGEVFNLADSHSIGNGKI